MNAVERRQEIVRLITTNDEAMSGSMLAKELDVSRQVIVQDIALLKANVGNNVKIKAAGGISSLEDADLMLKLGASRLGTSRIVPLFKELESGKTE